MLQCREAEHYAVNWDSTTERSSGLEQTAEL